MALLLLPLHTSTRVYAMGRNKFCKICPYAHVQGTTADNAIPKTASDQNFSHHSKAYVLEPVLGMPAQGFTSAGTNHSFSSDILASSCGVVVLQAVVVQNVPA